MTELETFELEQKQWAEKHLNVDDYESIFGVVSE